MEPSPGVKIGLMVINGIMMVYSMVIIVISAIALVSFYDFTTVLYDSLITIPAICIGVATAAFIMAVLGMVVSTRKSYCFGITFCVLISVVLTVELSLGIPYFVIYFINEWGNGQDGLHTSIVKYPQSLYAADWDWMQRQYACCGVDESRDWDVIVNATVRGLPVSCCQPIVGEVGKSECMHTSINRHVNGCHYKTRPLFIDNAWVSCGLLLGLVLLEIICIIFGSLFTHPLKNAW